MSNWIRCSDRMPGIGDQDIWLYDGKDVHHGYLFDGHDFVDWNEEYAVIKGVTHWMTMEMPEPPKEGE